MVFGIGQGAEMQKAYKRNNALLKKQKSLKELHQTYQEIDKPLAYNQITNEEFKEFKLKLKEERKKEKIKTVVLLGALITLGLLAMILLMN